MTLIEFLDYLLSEYYEKTGIDVSDESLGSFTKMALSDYSEKAKNSPVNKKNAARIVEEFLRHNLHESDLPIKEACVLKDLYDCRICTNSVAQVYQKGIIKPLRKDVFGMEEILSKDELIKVSERVFDKNKRLVPQNEEHS